MPIPESQFNTWSNQGATVNSSQAYARIKNALADLEGAPDIYLQGSYANSTNTYGNSDVDVVVHYDGCFHYDLSALSPDEQALHRAAHSDSDYSWHKWHGYVLKTLQYQIGSSRVSPGKKAIKVDLGGTKPADVLPVLTHKKYQSFRTHQLQSSIPGVQFFDHANTEIVNHPKLHIANGEAKNQAGRTAGRYKPTVRVFKNLRSCLIERRLLADGKISSDWRGFEPTKSRGHY